MRSMVLLIAGAVVGLAHCAAPRVQGAAPVSRPVPPFGPDLDEVMGDATKSLCFESMESSASVGYPVFNCVLQRAEGPRRTWWMRQRLDPKAGTDPRSWTLLSIEVEEHDGVPTASFHQYAAGPVDKAPVEVALSVPCARCHANGPRALRPANPGTLGGAFGKRVEAFNRSIEAMGAVATRRSATRTEEWALWGKDPRGAQTLSLPRCTGCHDGRARAVLRLWQRDTIRFLEAQGAMPVDGPLSPEDQSWLGRWLRGEVP